MSLDADDIGEAIQTAAAFGGKKHPSHLTGDPMVAGERTVRRFRWQLTAFIGQLPPDLTLAELSELLDEGNGR